MSHRDDEHLVPLLNMQEKNGTKCEEADADSAFGFIKNFVEAEEKQVILHAPLRDFDRKNYQYTTSNMIKKSKN